jgi:hypothetical protein
MKKLKEIPAKTKGEIDLAETQIVELSKRIEFYLTEYSVELSIQAKWQTGHPATESWPQ